MASWEADVRIASLGPSVRRIRRCLAFAVALVLTAGVADAQAAIFSNSAPFDVADGSGAVAPYTPGLAATYPATVAVSGLVGPIVDVNVTLNHVGHSRPDDLDVLLVGPHGQSVVLLSDSGEAVPLTGADLTFDDQATGPAPDMTGMGEGAYRPTNNFGGLGEPPDGNDVFPAPAPAPPRATTLGAAFNGTDANGTWSLYVLDDRPGETGAIAGWSLQITPTGVEPPPPPPPPSPPPPPPATPALPVPSLVSGKSSSWRGLSG